MGGSSNKKMEDPARGRSNMSQGPLDPATAALVRLAAAAAAGDVSELQERLAAAQAAGVPPLWIDELLLQSMLVVGYPLTLGAFGVWREVAGPAGRVGHAGGARARGGGSGCRRVPGGVRARLPQVAPQPARAASGARGPGAGGRLRQGDRSAGTRPEATRARDRGGDRGAGHRPAAALASARRAQHRREL